MIRFSFIIALVWASAAAAQSDDMKAKIVEGTKRECLINQRKADLNKTLSNETLTTYCACIGDHMFEVLSYSEVEQTANPPVPEAIQKKMNVLGMACYNVAK